MATVHQSIEVGVPVHRAYHQLTHFEDYPHFMDDVESVRQLDDTHLHWSAKVSGRETEWDTEITEQIQNRCIAWQTVEGPVKSSRVELLPIDEQNVRVTITVENAPEHFANGQEPDPDATLTRRLAQDLMQFKAWVEVHGAEHDKERDEHGGKNDRDGQSCFFSSSQSELGLDSALGHADRTMQSSNSLSQSANDEAEDGRFSVAEEVNFDQQSDPVRRVGQMPENLDVAGANPSDAIGAATAQDEKKKEDKLSHSIDRAVPPSV